MATLYIVATPIGNLEDISLRALRILKDVDFIICEDTRVTSKLLVRYEIRKPLVSYHHHTKLQKIDYIIDRLKRGENAALVSDAGTPGISDPGGILVHDAWQAKDDIKIVPIPGPSSLISLASVSGIPMEKFKFMGFPPHKKGRQTFFKTLLESDTPVIFFESNHRILKALNELKEFAVNKNFVHSEDGGEKSTVNIFSSNHGSGYKIIIGRELTKMFENIYRGNFDEIIKILESDKNNLKGEFTVILYR